MRIPLPVTSVSLVLLICLTGLPQLSETIYTPSLPDIAKNLGTTDALVQWTLSIYFVGFALGVFIWGRLSDSIGRRPAILLGMALYIIASLLCFFSDTIFSLLVYRFFQAVGISTGSVVVQTIARDVYAPDKRTQVFTIIVGVLALAPAIGPLIGGMVTQYLSWNFNFIILVALGALVMSAAYFKLPETHPGLSIERSKHSTIKHTAIRMVRDKNIMMFGVLVGIFNGLLFSFYSEAPFIFVDKLHLSYSNYGKLGIPLALASFGSALLSRRLGQFYHARVMIKTGSLLALSFSLLLVFFSVQGIIVPQYGYVALMAIMLPAMGIFASFNMVVPFALSQALEDYKDCLGTAGSLFGLGYYTLIAVITFGMGALHNDKVQTLPIYFVVLTSLMVLMCFKYYKHVPSLDEMPTN